tara:strand:+ start:5203 stop:5952 length:750 start_codon:yes stop_codon:yes gene_type:complete
MKKIHYAPLMNNYRDSYNHPLFEDEVFIKPERYLTYYKDDHFSHTYWNCHAWKEYYKNAFVIFCQQDITIDYEKDSGKISERSFDGFSFDEGNRNTGIPNVPIHFNGQQERPYNGVAIGQLTEHMFVWVESKDKNIWVETIQPQNITEKGMEIIPAEFPFSRWYRPLTFAYKFHKERTTISRGEPIGILKFKNYNSIRDSFSLEKTYPSERLAKKSFNHATLKNFLPGKSWDLLMNNQESKCPFKNFWK